MPSQSSLAAVAPIGPVTDYDRSHVALYAALLDAEAAGMTWQEVATTLMLLNPGQGANKRCWHSHLERARWIVGPGLATAVGTFGRGEA
jgi:hypothetical protein